MQRVVLRHRKGSKAGQHEEFPLTEVRTLTFGRDPSSEIRFDPDRDDLVGRQHARITHDVKDPLKFVLTDLSSRNGTFVNKVRLVGEHVLTVGDVIQLGAGGPEIEFDIDPRPATAVKATRIGGLDVAETRLGSAADAALVVGSISGTSPGGAAGGGSAKANAGAGAGVGAGSSPGVGKATVERLIGENRSRSHRTMFLGMAGVLGVALAFVGYTRYQTNQQLQLGSDANAKQIDSLRREQSRANTLSQQLQPAEIAARNSAAIVQVDFSWKLTYRGTGGQVYHRFVPNVMKGADGKRHPIIDNGREYLPAYVQVGNSLEPALTLDQNAGQPIGVSSRGSGFVVSENGFILTNRHVAYNWQAWYRFDPDAIGPVINPSSGEPLTDAGGNPVITRPPTQWIPAETRQAGPKGDIGDFQARVEYLYVRFPKDPTPFEASNVRPSQRHDVALIKVDAPQALSFVTMADTYDQTRQGDAVTVMGYPGVSEEVITVIKSRDMFNREMQQRTLPDPTLSTGNVGKILRAADAEVRDGFVMYAPSGDTYQLTINSTGGGNSGGPMFDGSGNVIGIYFAGKTADVQVSFAIPIRYGMELLRIGDPTASP